MKKIISIILASILAISSVVAVGATSVEISDELLNAINAERNKPLSKDEVEIMDMFEISHDKLMIRYKHIDSGVTGMSIDQRIGQYKLSLPYRPLPKILVGEKLYELSDAYYTGIINDIDLEKISAYEPKSFTLSKVGFLYGDVNRDARVSISDATLIQKYQAKSTENIDLEVADYDQDGEITVFDATAIQRKLAKIEAE